MTKEIIEYNLRCAKFLGMEDDAYILQQIIKKERFDTEIHLLFHYDWGWLMSVVESIEELNFKFEIYKDDDIHVINIINLDKECNINVTSKNMKNVLILSINQFLIWYEQQNEINNV